MKAQRKRGAVGGDSVQRAEGRGIFWGRVGRGASPRRPPHQAGGTATWMPTETAEERAEASRGAGG